MFTALKDKQRRLRDGFDAALSLRVHRAISWIEGAERAAAAGNDDGAFISYWIAFNAAYVRRSQLPQQFQEKDLFRSYFECIAQLDRKGVIRKAVQKRIDPTRRLLQNPFVYRLFWYWRYGEGYENWQDSFVRESRTMELALNRQDTVAVLKTLFGRLYVLRNQLIHGGATWGGGLNREQVRDGAKIMAALVPHFVNLMMDNPHEDWGESPYPVDADRHGMHDAPGGWFRRRGDAKRQMHPDEYRRLVQARGFSDAAVDEQTVAGTSLNTLTPDLWRRYASSRAGEPPEVALGKLKFLKDDQQGTPRATVGGVLLGCEEPRDWLPNAYIQAVCYGSDRMDSNRQLDALDVSGPLDAQILGAMRFVMRNRRVAARKTPERCEVPQYSERAVFEAVVNAVVHRDYAVTGSHIRLFLFDDRLELYSPGGLGNSMTTDDLRTSQYTRNNLLASRLGQCPVGDVAGAGERRYFIEQRGEGIGAIEDETFALTGEKPVFELVGERELRLTLPAAPPPPPEGIALRVAVVDDRNGEPLRNVHVLALYPNKTCLEAHTDAFGHADFRLHSDLPMTVLCAAPGFAATVARGHQPGGALELRMEQLADGGSLIIPSRTGHLPGIQGRLNPILDALDRTYLYAGNIAINDGAQHPVYFALNDPIRLTDANGAKATVWFREMLGESSVFDYVFEDG